MKIPSEVLWTCTLGICLVEDRLWYSPMAFNGIFCADIHTGTTRLISELSAFDERYNGLKFSCALQIGDYLYFCPYEANCICGISSRDMNMEFYYSDFISAPRVSKVVCVQEKLYMFCNKQLQIIIFDTKSKEISVIRCEDFAEKFRKGSFPEKDVAYYDTSFYMADSQKIVEFNIQAQEVYEHDLSQYVGDREVTTICFDGRRFWLMCGESEIIGWSREEGVVGIYEVPKLGQAVQSIINGSNLYIFFADNNSVLVFGLTDRKSSVIDIARGYCCEQGEKTFFHPFVDKNDKDGMYIYTFLEQKVVHLRADGNVSYTELHIDQEDTSCRELYTNYLQRMLYPVKGIMHERKDLFYYSLEGYLGGVISGLESDRDLRDSVGQKIYYSIG